MVKVVVNGASGRMGKAIIELLEDFPGAVLAGALEREGHPDLGRSAAGGVVISADAAGVIARGEVVIDFTTPAATLACLGHCLAAGKPLVTGTTGFSAPEAGRVRSAAGRIAVLHAPNMSLGVNVLFELAARAAELLPGYQAEIVEIHHGLKVDAPSGTAVRLGEVVAAGQGRRLDRCAVYGRRGAAGPRSGEEIGIHAVRLGEVVGEHTLLLAGPGERLELTHRAASRHNFARGAIQAAVFLVGRPPGAYSMADLLATGRGSGPGPGESA